MITHESQMKGAKVLRERADARAELILGLVERGWTTEQLAYRLGIHQSSVRTVLHRARKRLAERAAEAPLSPAPGPGEYYVDPNAREAYKPAERRCTCSLGYCDLCGN